MNELPLRKPTIQNLENRRSNSMQDPENSKRKGEVCKRLGFEKIQNEYKKVYEPNNSNTGKGISQELILVPDQTF